MVWMHSKTFGTSQLGTTLSTKQEVISLYMGVSATPPPSRPVPLMTIAPWRDQRSSGHVFRGKALSWKLDLLHGGDLQHRRKRLGGHWSRLPPKNVPSGLVVCGCTCWYEVVYTMTFCCWPSAVMIPAGSGLADGGRKVYVKETGLQDTENRTHSDYW